jgi:hypothetical protein
VRGTVTRVLSWLTILSREASSPGQWTPDRRQRRLGSVTREATRALIALGLALIVLAGCGGPARAPLYTPEELRVTCERQGGWWRPNILDGYCEYQFPGFL